MHGVVLLLPQGLPWSLTNATCTSYLTGKTVAVLSWELFRPFQSLLLPLPYRPARLPLCTWESHSQMELQHQYLLYATMMLLWCLEYILALHPAEANTFMRWHGRDMFGPIGWDLARFLLPLHGKVSHINFNQVWCGALLPLSCHPKNFWANSNWFTSDASHYLMSIPIPISRGVLYQSNIKAWEWQIMPWCLFGWNYYLSSVIGLLTLPIQRPWWWGTNILW